MKELAWISFIAKNDVDLSICSVFIDGCHYSSQLLRQHGRSCANGQFEDARTCRLSTSRCLFDASERFGLSHSEETMKSLIWVRRDIHVMISLHKSLPWRQNAAFLRLSSCWTTLPFKDKHHTVLINWPVGSVFAVLVGLFLLLVFWSFGFS